MKVLWGIVFVLLAVPCFGQREAENWYFGDSAAITFKYGKPEAVTNSTMYAEEGCASISDENGNLLFYTNSNKVWNAQHQIMSNGNNMMGGDYLGGDGSGGDYFDDWYKEWYGGSYASQAALIVPHPGNTNQFYIFIAPQSGTSAIPNLYYSIVDMSKDGGLGEVVKKNVRYPVPACEKLTATIDCNGKGFWVVTHHNFKNEFYSIHISQNGIESKFVISQTGLSISEKNYGGYGNNNCMKISPDGNLLVSPTGAEGAVELFNFDNSTGKISNPRRIFDGLPYGVSFSPDNSKLYLNEGNRFYQFQVSASATAEEIIKTEKLVYSRPSVNEGNGSLQIGPDGKIYFTPWSYSQLDAISEPNNLDPKYTEEALINDLPGRNTRRGLPNFIDNIFNEGESPISCKSYFLNDTICEGGFASFKDTAATSLISRWQWEFPGGVPMTSTEQNPTNIRYTVAGEYPVKLIRFSSYFGSDTVFSNVLVHPRPIADAGSDITLCTGSSAHHGTPAIAGNTYLWTPIDGLDNPNIAQPRVTPVFDVKKYFLKVTNSFGCESIDSVIVSIGEIQAIVRDTSVCRGSSVVLKATGGSEYEWSPSNGLSATTGASVTASPLETTVYRLIAKSSECRDTAFLKVTVLDVPVADAGSDKDICAGESVELGAAAEVGLSYLWTPAVGLSNPSISNPTATVLKTTEFILTVTNEWSCVAHDTVLVSVSDLLKVTAMNDTAICTGAEVQLDASSPDADVQYKWSPEIGLSNTNIANPIAKPTETTTYTVTAFKNGGLCSAVDSVRIEVLKLPEVTTKDITLCEGETAELFAQSNDEAVTWSWTPTTGLSNPNIQNPVITAFKSEIYTVTATNKSGCTAFKTLSVTVTEKENITAVLKSDKAELEPGESTLVRLLLKAENSAGITSFKVLVHFDANVFQFTKYSGKFLNGADNTWFLQADIIAPGVLEIEANGQTPIASSELSFELTAYLSKQTTEDILLKLTEKNGEVLTEEELCKTIATESTKILLKEVCAGDMRLVNVGEFQTALQQVTPNPVTNETIEINYSVGIEGVISLEMYNSQGELLKTIFKGNQKAGIFKETFSTEEIPAGVFLVKLSTLQATETQMFTLVK